MNFANRVRESRRNFKAVFEQFKKLNPDLDNIIDYTPIMADIIKVYLKDGRKVVWDNQTSKIVMIYYD